MDSLYYEIKERMAYVQGYLCGIRDSGYCDINLEPINDYVNDTVALLIEYGDDDTGFDLYSNNEVVDHYRSCVDNDIRNCSNEEREA